MNSGAAFLLVAMSLVWLALPVAAVVLALVAMGKAGRAERAARERERETEALRARLIKMEQRLARVESAGPGATDEPPAVPVLAASVQPFPPAPILAAAAPVPAVAIGEAPLPGGPAPKPEFPEPASASPSLPATGSPALPPGPPPAEVSPEG